MEVVNIPWPEHSHSKEYLWSTSKLTRPSLIRYAPLSFVDGIYVTQELSKSSTTLTSSVVAMPRCSNQSNTIDNCYIGFLTSECIGEYYILELRVCFLIPKDMCCSLSNTGLDPTKRSRLQLSPLLNRYLPQLDGQDILRLLLNICLIFVNFDDVEKLETNKSPYDNHVRHRRQLSAYTGLQGIQPYATAMLFGLRSNTCVLLVPNGQVFYVIPKLDTSQTQEPRWKSQWFLLIWTGPREIQPQHEYYFETTVLLIAKWTFQIKDPSNYGNTSQSQATVGNVSGKVASIIGKNVYQFVDGETKTRSNTKAPMIHGRILVCAPNWRMPLQKTGFQLIEGMLEVTHEVQTTKSLFRLNRDLKQPNNGFLCWFHPRTLIASLVQIVQKIIERSVNAFYGSRPHDLGIISRAGSGPGSERKSKVQQESKGETQATTHARSKRQRESKKRDQENEDSDSDSSSERLSSLSNKKRKKQHSAPKFGCPYFKKDPWKYHQCLNRKLSKISYVKQHLMRCHIGPKFYCPTCGQTFEKQDEVDGHIVARDCEPCQFYFEGMTMPQQTEVLNTTARSMNEDQKWYQIWSILFPSIPKPRSPYMEDTIVETMESIRSFCHGSGSQIVQETLREEGFTESQFSIIDKIFERIQEKARSHIAEPLNSPTVSSSSSSSSSSTEANTNTAALLPTSLHGICSDAKERSPASATGIFDDKYGAFPLPEPEESRFYSGYGGNCLPRFANSISSISDPDWDHNFSPTSFCWNTWDNVNLDSVNSINVPPEFFIPTDDAWTYNEITDTVHGASGCV
ncbi:hypothetical protein F5B20DRAFT_544764 [Whalleya microplaca]|nr:hypothetical protein F5B20DRAFT_544764 [Whalleya microplaca]